MTCLFQSLTNFLLGHLALFLLICASQRDALDHVHTHRRMEGGPQNSKSCREATPLPNATILLKSSEMSVI